jgi:hypothetical protein
MTVGPIVLAASVLVIIGILIGSRLTSVAAGDASETTSSSAALPF